MSQLLTELDAAITKNKFWGVYHTFCENLFQENLNIDEFISFLPKLFKRTEKDLGHNKIFNAVSKFTEYQPEKGIELLNKLKKWDNEKIQELIPSALEGLSKSNTKFNGIYEIKSLLENDSNILKKQGYLSLLAFSNTIFSKNNDFAIYINNSINSDIEKSNTIFYSYIVKVLGKFVSVLPTAKEKLLLFSHSDLIEIQYEIAILLGYELNFSDDSNLYSELLFNLKKCSPKSNGTIWQLDHTVLSKFIMNNPQLIHSFLDNWLLFDDKRFDDIIKFKNTFEKLYEKNNEYFKLIITSWLNSDNPVFHLAVCKLLVKLSHDEMNEIELSVDYIQNLSFKDIQFIISKIIGYIYFKEPLRSSIYSILEIKIDDKECVEYIKSVFTTYLIFNYPSTLEYLEEKKKYSSKKLKNIIKEIIDIGNSYFDDIYKLDFINEFSPSEKRLNIYNNFFQKGLQTKQEEEESNDFLFMKMLKNIQLRTGKGMFTKYEDRYTEKTEMSLIQYSTELPRGEFIDTVGQERLRAMSRMYKREI